jgi:hypothetical protein
MNRRLKRSVALLLLALTLAAPRATRADTAEAEDVHKLCGYLSCAVAVVGATTGVMIAAAILTCGALVAQEAGV